MAKPKAPAADPQTCASCKHFESNNHDDAGYCVAHPPTPIPAEQGYVCVIPVVTADWRCGEFARKLQS